MKLLLAFWDEVGEFFVKNLALILSLMAGTAAKIALDSRTRRLSKRDVAIKVVLSFFVGYLGSIYMDSHGLQVQAKWGVPLITLLGESIVMWIMGNSKKIFNAALLAIFPNKDKKL